MTFGQYAFLVHVLILILTYVLYGLEVLVAIYIFPESCDNKIA